MSGVPEARSELAGSSESSRARAQRADRTSVVTRRDVAVVSYVSSAVPRDAEHNETEMIVPVLQATMAQSGVPKGELGFVCSGSLDYLQGGPFAFVWK